MYPGRPETSLRRFFSGLTEYAFETRLGMADPGLVDYIAELLDRFMRSDSIYGVRNPAGKRLDEVAAMVVEAEARVGDARRQVHRHIGDFTLFWTGVYPEALPHLQRPDRRDFFLDYSELGKRAYLIASRIPVEENPQENEILERLSHDFDVCRQGLRELRREWERRDGDSEDTPPLFFSP